MRVDIWRRKLVTAGSSGPNLTPVLWVCHPSSMSSASLPGTCAKVMEGCMNMNMNLNMNMERISNLSWEFAWERITSIKVGHARWRIMDFCKSSKYNALQKASGWSALGLSGTAPSWGCSACSSACQHPLWLTTAVNIHVFHTIQSTECFEEVFADLWFISFGAIRHSSILRLLCLLIGLPESTVAHARCRYTWASHYSVNWMLWISVCQPAVH